MSHSPIVLVVDDNEHNRVLAGTYLASAGYTVVFADGGEAALLAFEAETPDLVLLDVQMPRMNGFETCVRLRQARKGRDVAILFLTALSDLGTHQAALDSGADDFISKPIQRTELLLRVRSLLWVKRLKDELVQGYDLIRTQRDALLDAERSREELTALLIHDLKNPLASIVMNSQLLLEEPMAEEPRSSVEEIMQAATSMHRMCMNLLDISRSADGALAPRYARLNVPELLVAVRASCARVAEARQQRIDITPADEAFLLDGDSDLLSRLLENLVVNAMKYSPAGSRIQIEAGRAGGDIVEFRVRDEGPGVEPGMREAIFDRHTRVDGAPEESTSRGLGLRYCRLAATVHGGRVWVSANEPCGSVFFVQIPLTRSEPCQNPRP